jgi:hypothetical protein
VIRFDASRAQDLDATLELRVRFRRMRKPVPFTLRIETGRLRLRPGAAAKPGATATIGAGDLGRLAIGTSRWPELLASGRLELGGDPFLALRFPMLFRLPAQ